MNLDKKKVLVVGHIDIDSGLLVSSALKKMEESGMETIVITPDEAKEIGINKPEPYIFNERQIEPIINKRHDSHIRMKSGKELRRERRLIERNKNNKKK